MATKIKQTVRIIRTTRKIGGKKLTQAQINAEFEREHPRGPDGRFIRKSS